MSPTSYQTAPPRGGATNLPAALGEPKRLSGGADGGGRGGRARRGRLSRRGRRGGVGRRRLALQQGHGLLELAACLFGLGRVRREVRRVLRERGVGLVEEPVGIGQQLRCGLLG